MSHYCEIAAKDPLHRDYHDREWGRRCADESRLFEYLLLEINQAGLSWDLMLRKRDTLRQGYADCHVDRVAAFGDEDVHRLLQDTGVIRHRGKITALIHNARVIQGLRESDGGFCAWLDHHHPREKADWVELFRKTFRFTGPEVVNEFLMCTGYLPAHQPECPIHAQITRR